MRRLEVQSANKTDRLGLVQRWAVRVGFWALVFLTAAALLGLVVSGLYRWLVTRNPYFTLRDISLQGGRFLTREMVQERLRQAGAVVGASNLMRLPVRHLRQTLEQDPLIARAQVARRLPDVLQVTVQERLPVAIVKGRAPCLLDSEGIVLPWRDTTHERLLPEIVGVRPPAVLVPGQPVQDEALLGAVRLLRLLARRADGSNYDIETIQIDYLLPSLTLHLRARGIFAQGAQVVVPVAPGDMEAALDRLRDIVRIRNVAGKPITRVDATYRRNVPVEPL